MNSYQKLKKENERLKEDIHTIITKRNSTEAQILIMTYNMQYNLDEAVWRGLSIDINYLQNAHIKNNEGYLIGSGFDITKPETFKQAVKLEMFQDMDCPCPNK